MTPSTATCTTCTDLQTQAREELKHALASRRLKGGRVAFGARDAGKVIQAIRRLRPPEVATTGDPRTRLLRTTIGVPDAVGKLEHLDLPEPASKHVSAALSRASEALQMRKAALAGDDHL